MENNEFFEELYNHANLENNDIESKKEYLCRLINYDSSDKLVYERIKEKEGNYEGFKYIEDLAWMELRRAND